MSIPNPLTTKWIPLWNTGASSPAGSGMLTGDLIWSVLATRAGSVACDGALYNSVADNTFAALYAAIGTTYGGTGPASFAVPDVRGRLLVCRGTNPDVDAVGKNDGVSTIANRTPLHWHPSALTWSGSFAGIAQNTTTESVTHTHGFDADTGYISADHVHGVYDYYTTDGGSGQGRTYSSPPGNFREPSNTTGMRGVSSNHTHHVNGGTYGQSANHVHAATAAGTVSGNIAGYVGSPRNDQVQDRPAYIVENCFIVK